MYKTNGSFQLGLQTLSLVVGFMTWSIISPLMPYMSEDIKISETQLSVIVAVPVILGSILRIPLGYLTNLISAKWVFFWSFVVLLFPIYLLGQAQSSSMLMISGLFLGVGGAVFSVGVTSLPKYFDKDKVGLVNGIYGIGNIGTAVSAFLAPPMAGVFSWQTTVRFYLIIIALFAILMFFFGDGKEKRVKVSLKQIFRLAANYKIYYLSFWYFITFGSFVAFGLFLPNYLVNHFGIDKVDAGIRTGIFIAIATFIRPIGGIIGDKTNAIKSLMVSFVFLIFGAVILGISSHITLFTIGCLLISFCAGIGNGLIFKLVPTYFQNVAGSANGVVSMMGGLGGFFPPLIITYTSSLTGSSHLAFILLAILGVISFITMLHLYKKESTIKS
ncbi:nitrate/nitrite transporter [Staphylococcus equorum]|uniref:nitrate/nitrite transporter n=1 Tax=Staphylococcus equorum TaxID=246432 RepID=UPI0037D9E727